jgi:hexokinase
MALADESNRIVEQFEFPDEDLNRHVKEFLRQMGMLLYRSAQSVTVPL